MRFFCFLSRGDAMASMLVIVFVVTGSRLTEVGGVFFRLMENKAFAPYGGYIRTIGGTQSS